ncbi:MAG: hypothetical protein VB131_03400 [Burkholderia gladioli]
MGKLGRKRDRAHAARQQSAGNPQEAHDSAAVRRLIDMDSAESPHRHQAPASLPLDYIDLLRAVRHPIFNYADVDLQRMRQSGETPEQIFPPNSRCNEEPYAEAWLRNAAQFPQSNPWIFNRDAMQSALEGSLAEYRAVLSFLHAGSKTYFFGEAIAESLSYTALNMPARSLKLPVPAFEFVFHSEAAAEAFHACSGTPMRAVRTISVFVREDTLQEVGCRRLIIVALEHDDSLRTAPTVQIRRLAMREDWDLETALNTDWSKAGMGPQGNGVSWATTPDGELIVTEDATAQFLDDKVRFIRMVLNGILYITSRGAEITEKLATRPVHVSKRHRDSSPGSTARTYSAVGESIKQIPVVIDPTVRYDALHQSASKRSVKVRFLVPGFWRRPKNSAPDADKDVWVREHYRGPEMADLVNNPYIVR